MTDVVQARCPHCKNVLRIPANWVAQPMRCKFCSNIFQARSSAPPATPPQPIARPAVAPARNAVVAAPAAVPANPFSIQHAAVAPSTSAGRRRYRPRGSGGWWMGILLCGGVLALAAIVAVVYREQLSELIPNTPSAQHRKEDAKDDSQAKANDPGANPENGTKNPPDQETKKDDTNPQIKDKKDKEKKDDTPIIVVKDKEKKDKEKKDDTPIVIVKDKEKKDKEKKDKEKKDDNPIVIVKDKEKKDKEKKDKEKKDDPPIVVVKDKEKKDKQPEIVVPAAYPRRALVISVNDYLFANPLGYGSAKSGQFPGSSPREVIKHLNKNLEFPPGQCLELCDRDNISPHAPLKSVIEGTITEFLDSSRPQDRIVLLFTGHAVEIDKEAYLVPLEGDLNDAKTLIPLDWVYRQLRNCKARQKVLILDVCRYNPAAGNLRPGSGEMGEDFDRKLQQPPGGVQVLTACIAKQQSFEFDSGSLFLQALNDALAAGPEGGDAPEKELPVELLRDRINAFMDKQLDKAKFEQMARLSGKAPATGAGPNKMEPVPPQIEVAPPVVPGGQPPAPAAQVKAMLDEINKIPPVRGARANKDDLKVANLPWFPANVMKEYQAESTAPELKKSVLAAVKALDDSSRLQFQDRFFGANNAQVKKMILGKQGDPGRAVLALEEALEDLKKAGEDHMGKEKSRHWRAHYDYTLARLESRLVYLMEYNYTLAQIRSDTLPELPPGFAGYVLGAKEKVTIPESKVKDWVKDIRRTWDKIAKEHPNTPYAIMANRERMTVLGLEWRPAKK
jgi:hypothetical protein